MERLKIKKYRHTDVPYIQGKDPKCFENVMRMNIPPGDVFHAWTYGERQDKVFDDDSPNTYTTYDILITYYFVDESDSEYFNRMKVEQQRISDLDQQRKYKEDQERLLYLTLKAKYEGE